MNRILKIQDILMNQMERLDDEEIMKVSSKKEIMRSGALSQSASSFLKAVNTSIKIEQMAKENKVDSHVYNDKFGIIVDEK